MEAHRNHIHIAMPGGGLVPGGDGAALIPAFGDGGLITQPTLGILGDKGPELALPLNGSSPIAVQVFLGTREITDILDVRVQTAFDQQGRALGFGPRPNF